MRNRGKQQVLRNFTVIYYLISFGPIFADKLLDVKLSLAALVVHVADLPEDRSLGPALVVDATDAPHDSDKSWKYSSERF